MAILIPNHSDSNAVGTKTNGCYIPRTAMVQMATMECSQFGIQTIRKGEGASRQVELMVEEVDSEGSPRLRSLEQFFYGIVGHVKDKWGYPIYGWAQASRIANYWRGRFNIPEIPGHEPHQTQEPMRNIPKLVTRMWMTPRTRPSPHHLLRCRSKSISWHTSCMTS